MSYTTTQGDTDPPMILALTSSGVPIDLTGSVVTMRWLKPDALASVTVTLTILDPTGGTVQRSWDAGDLSAPGQQKAQVVITRGSSVTTYPTDGTFITWQVNKKL